MSVARGPGRDRSRRPSDVTVFFVLTYALSWVWLVPLALTGAVVTAGTGWPTHVPALFGPLAAAVLLTAVRNGRRGLRDLGARMIRWRVAVRWWLFAVSPLLVLAVVLGADAAFRRPFPAFADFAVFSGLPAGGGVLAVAGLLLVGGFGEETGWRGYALPELQRRRSPLVATVIVGLCWIGWHAPLFLVVESYRSFGVVVTIGWIIGLACGAVVLCWLYNHSGGSILLVVVWHTTYNLISGTAAAEGLPAAASTALVIGFAAVLVGLELRAVRRGTPTVLGPAPLSSRPDDRRSAGG